jgi:hypothetical protein
VQRINVATSPLWIPAIIKRISVAKGFSLLLDISVYGGESMTKKIIGLMFVLIFSTANAAYNFDSNVPANIKQQMIEDLQFVTTIEGSQTSGLHQKIFGAMTGATYQSFFENHIEGIGLNSCGSANAVACVIPWAGKKMFITQNYIKFSHPAIARLMVVFHEARHTESQHGNWGHATCPTPFRDAAGNDLKSIWTGAQLAGQPACDVTPEGSYGSSMIMLKNISKFCESCAEKVKMDAGIYADDQFGRVIDQAARDAITADLY